MPRTKNASETPFSEPYRRLQKRLNQIGWVALGSVIERNKLGKGGPVINGRVKSRERPSLSL